MKWSQKFLEELNEIVTYLKKSNMGIMLEVFANYYMKRHMKYLEIKKFQMEFTEETITPSDISNGEYKLAYICELIYLRCKKKNERKPRNVYECFSNMLRYCIRKKFTYIISRFDNSEYYLLDLLKQHFDSSELCKTFDKQPFEQTFDKQTLIKNNLQYDFSYYLITEIMKNEDISLLTSLTLNGENLDISFLNTEARRSMGQILKTKRTLYLRFLLILTFEMLKIPNTLNSNWLNVLLHFSDKDSFISVLTSPLIETIIFLTYYKMK